jgi:predicted MPP superfamily phosphohydrolase
MILRTLELALLCLCAALLFAEAKHSEHRSQPGTSVVIAQISDFHIDLARAPGAEDQLRKAVEMINARSPDAVVVSGDIGDKAEESWKKAQAILLGLHSKFYVLPGNHDVNAKTVDKYRAVFGDDTYRFEVNGQPFVAIDSQLLGSWEHFESAQPEPVPAEAESQADALLDTLTRFGSGVCAFSDRDCVQWNWDRDRRGLIAIQHVPPDRPPKTSPDEKPYWILHDPWRTRELELLRKLHVKHILAGHWHKGIVYEVDGFTIHVAPATSWSPESPLGFALHTITADGKVNTEFVYFDEQPSLKSNKKK